MSINNLCLGWSISESQNKEIQNFINNCLSDGMSGPTIGGRFTYQITPTSLGAIIKVLDNFSKKEIDITDYEAW